MCGTRHQGPPLRSPHSRMALLQCCKEAEIARVLPVRVGAARCPSHPSHCRGAQEEEESMTSWALSVWPRGDGHIGAERSTVSLGRGREHRSSVRTAVIIIIITCYRLSSSTHFHILLVCNLRISLCSKHSKFSYLSVSGTQRVKRCPEFTLSAHHTAESSPGHALGYPV